MTDENRVSNIIEWTDAGTAEVIRASEAVRDSVTDTTEKINDANAALGDLDRQIGDMPTIALPPPMPIPFDTEEVKAANEQIKQSGEKMVDAGKASEMLYSALDNVIPGLGGITESLFSLNPVAIAGTAIVAGLTLAFKAQADQAEATRKAIEAQVKAESDRAFAAKDIEQKLSLALSGDKEARARLIQEYAEAAEQHAKVDAEFTNLRQQNVDALAAYNQKVEELRKEAEGSEGAFIESLALANTAEKQRLDATKTALEGYSGTLTDSLNNTNQLNDALKDLNLTQEEQAAIALAASQGAEATASALDKLTEATEGSSETLKNAAKGFSDIFEGIGEDALKFAQKTAEETAKAREDAEKRLVDINEKLTSVESERGKALADQFIEQQRAAEFAKLDTQLAAAQAYDKAREKNAKIAEIQQQGQAADVAAQQKFMQDQQKLLGNYLKGEQTATEDYSRERVRKLEDLYNTLNDLASKRDVAGFVNARRSGMTDIGRGDEDAGLAARRRREAYDQQQADLVNAANKETTTRQAQLQQRLQQEQQAGQQQITMADRVRKQIADLQAKYAAQDLQAKRMAEESAYRQTVDILQRKRNDELKITQGAAAGVISILSNMRDSITRLSSSIGQGAARAIPRFEEGTPYVQKTGLAVIHQGERIMTAADNAQFMRGGGGRQMGPVTINMSVGEIATPSQVAAVEQRIVSAITSFASNGNN
jgi:hypothetical protein